ncbi:hypothetical protein BLA29_006997 [Euroglyphus maynei]|uniref:Uncharacterized protein n=1 Tax=Euroglyphus maynei TaxID=6958 RepID=A0A1Y3BV04_EURMA|nr:hypothetical protein BLA29_006997 [Euroglyphus maynei]
MKQQQTQQTGEKVIVAKEAIELYHHQNDKKPSSSSSVEKPDWYLKLKEPPKSNLSGHSKLLIHNVDYKKADDKNLTKKHGNNDNCDDDNEPYCFFLFSKF